MVDVHTAGADHLVVKRKFCARFEVLVGKDSDASVTKDIPFLDCAFNMESMRQPAKQSLSTGNDLLVCHNSDHSCG